MCAKGQNWLITSASAKVDLVRRMRAAVNASGSKLYVTDVDPLAASFHFADGFAVLPALDTGDYYAALVGYCHENGVGVVLPTRDADVAFLAANKRSLASEGVLVIVSPQETVDICLDKIAFHEHCLCAAIPVLPRVGTLEASVFPCFVRSRVGAGGLGAQKVGNMAEFEALYSGVSCDDLLVQRDVDLPEFTVDILFAADGTAVQWVARERLRVKKGESCVGETVQISALDDVVVNLGQSMSFVGPVTLQCFYTPESGPYVIEVNPRIGGGAALGIEAGLDTPARLVQLVQGDAEAYAQPRPLHYGLKMFRYSADLFVS